MQPASGLLPVGEGPLGDCQAPRHASGAIGLVDRKPAAVRPPVRQSTRLDDEGAQFAPGDAALSESVDRSYIPECPSLRMSRCPGCRACRAISDRISAWPLDKYELYLEEARRDLVGQNSLFRDLDQKARNASVTTLSLMGLTALLLRTSAEVHSLAEVAGLVAGGAGLTTLITSLVALRIRDFDSAPMTDLGLATFDQPNWKPTNLRKWLGKRLPEIAGEELGDLGSQGAVRWIFPVGNRGRRSPGHRY